MNATHAPKRRNVSSWRLGRRDVLRGAAGAAIGLPFLDAMQPWEQPANAQDASAIPQRFVVWYQPGGALRDRWIPHPGPTGSETDFILHDTLEPLEPFREQLILIDGLDIGVREIGVGHPHFRGLAAFLTGSYLGEGDFAGQDGAAIEKTGWAQNISLDQLLAQHIGQTTKFPSVELCVRHDGERGPHPNRIMSYEGPDQPVAPIVDPLLAWEQLFVDFTTDAATLKQLRAHKKSILDAVKQEYTAVAPRVSTADRSKLENHLSRIREVELSFDTVTTAGAGCNVADAPPTTVFNSDNFEQMGKLMMRTLVMAITCDITRVISLKWIDPLARNLITFLGIEDNGKTDVKNSMNHHCVQHNCSFQPDKLMAVERWYAEQFAEFLGLISEVEEQGQPLFDNLVVYHGTEISDAPVHSLVSVPYMLAGNLGGQYRTGRFLQYDHRSNNDLLVALQNGFGIDSDSFGEPGFSDGPLPGLG